MKKIIASAVGLVLVGGVAVTNASAVESQFGGYWRTRMFFEDNFTQADSAANLTDTRTRLYYTAKFSDDLKFVNKFEFNTSWGDNEGGDIGADAKDNFRVKNSYVDFNLGMVNAKVGIQNNTISRGFIFSDDMSGVVVTADFGMVKVPFLYAAVSSEDAEDIGWDGNGAESMVFSTGTGTTAAFGGAEAGDVHMLSIMPQININDSIAVTPHGTWATVTEQDTDIYWFGVDADLKFESFSAWATGIYNGGSVDNGPGVEESDISAYLLAAGAEAGIVHGQAFYASGDDDAVDSDIDSFVAVGGPGYGASYYWSEILGLGVFDNAVDGTQADKITNIWALNAGVTVKPMDKLKLDFDVWYAQLAEEILASNNQLEDELGLELDAKLTYEVLDNLNAEFIFAYLFAGDAIGPEDVMEGGVQLSLKF